MSRGKAAVSKRTYSAYGLPPGLVIDPETGVISGTPTVPGRYTATIRYTSRSERAIDWFLKHWKPVIRITRGGQG